MHDTRAEKYLRMDGWRLIARRSRTVSEVQMVSQKDETSKGNSTELIQVYYILSRFNINFEPLQNWKLNAWHSGRKLLTNGRVEVDSEEITNRVWGTDGFPEKWN